MKHAAAGLLVCLVTLGANAQPVYRCGNEYSQSPCPQGKIVEATDPRTAAQRAEAMRVAADERRRAADMQRERLAEQAAQRPALAGSLSGAPPRSAKPATASERHHPKKKRTLAKFTRATRFIAVDPSGRKQPSRN